MAKLNARGMDDVVKINNTLFWWVCCSRPVENPVSILLYEEAVVEFQRGSFALCIERVPEMGHPDKYC